MSITTSVNGQPYPAGPNAQQSCGAGSCALTATGAIKTADLHAGDNDVEVDVTDVAGNVGTEEWAIELPGEDPMVQNQEASDYSTQQNVPLNVAQAAVAAQDQTAPLLPQLETDLGNAFAGAWYDTTTNVLNLAVAAPNPPTLASVQQAQADLSAANVPLTMVNFVAVTSNWDQLIAAQEALDSQLDAQEMAGQVATAIDPQTNAVVQINTPPQLVEMSASAAGRRSHGGRRNEVRVARGPWRGRSVKVRQTVRHVKSLALRAFACRGFGSFFGAFGGGRPPYTGCDNPVRGGVAMVSPPNYGAGGYNLCTPGFLGFASGFRALLTAGHCIRDTGGCLGSEWGSLNSRGGRFPFGHPYPAVAGAHCYVDDGVSGDYGTISLVNGARVGRHSYIYVASSRQTQANSAYWIHRLGDRPAKNMIVCNSSGPLLQNGSHTSCGYVLYPSHDVVLSGTKFYHLIITSNCGEPGSSGGPLFRRGVGYGLLLGGPKGVTQPQNCQADFEPATTAAAGQNFRLN